MKFRLGEVEISKEVMSQKLGRLGPTDREHVLLSVAGTTDAEAIESPLDIERLVIVAIRKRAWLDWVRNEKAEAVLADEERRKTSTLPKTNSAGATQP